MHLEKAIHREGRQGNQHHVEFGSFHQTGDLDYKPCPLFSFEYPSRRYLKESLASLAVQRPFILKAAVKRKDAKDAEDRKGKTRKSILTHWVTTIFALCN
jgi:hypothetical protein